MTVKKADRKDIAAVLPKGFDLDAFEALGIVSRYGWKIVELGGVKRVSAATESDYREVLGSMREQGLKVDGDAACWATGPVGCQGGPCYCHLWLDWKRHVWVCSC
jgi:hypothetical protein